VLTRAAFARLPPVVEAADRLAAVFQTLAGLPPDVLLVALRVAPLVEDG
jgi:hypothetical protein